MLIESKKLENEILNFFQSPFQTAVGYHNFFPYLDTVILWRPEIDFQKKKKTADHWIDLPFLLSKCFENIKRRHLILSTENSLKQLLGNGAKKVLF